MTCNNLFINTDAMPVMIILFTRTLCYQINTSCCPYNWSSCVKRWWKSL